MAMAQVDAPVQQAKEDPAARKRALDFLWGQVLLTGGQGSFGSEHPAFKGRERKNFELALDGVLNLGLLSEGELLRRKELLMLHAKTMWGILGSWNAALAAGASPQRLDTILVDLRRSLTVAFTEAKKVLADDPAAKDPKTMERIAAIYGAVGKTYLALIGQHERQVAAKAPKPPSEAEIGKDREIMSLRAEYELYGNRYKQLSDNRAKLEADYRQKDAHQPRSRKGKEEKKEALAELRGRIDRLDREIAGVRKDVEDRMLAIAKRREELIVAARPPAPAPQFVVDAADRLRLLDVVERYLLTSNLSGREKAEFRKAVAGATPAQLAWLISAAKRGDKSAFGAFDQFRETSVLAGKPPAGEKAPATQATAEKKPPEEAARVHEKKRAPSHKGRGSRPKKVAKGPAPKPLDIGIAPSAPSSAELYYDTRPADRASKPLTATGTTGTARSTVTIETPLPPAAAAAPKKKRKNETAIGPAPPKKRRV